MIILKCNFDDGTQGIRELVVIPTKTEGSDIPKEIADLIAAQQHDEDTEEPKRGPRRLSRRYLRRQKLEKPVRKRTYRVESPDGSRLFLVI